MVLSGKKKTFSKPTHKELAKASQSEVIPFVAASVGRLSNLFPHWMLLRVEGPNGIPSSRLMTLWLLSGREDMAMGEISKAIDLTPRGVTRIVDGLESDGLAKRRPDEEDKRVKIVTLTAKGRQFVKRSFPAAQAEFSSLFSVLTAKESIEFVRLLEKVTDRMKHQIDNE